jgi:type I restriction enzyme, R subunit
MNENIVEQAALGWFEALGYHTARGADISPGAAPPCANATRTWC